MHVHEHRAPRGAFPRHLPSRALIMTALALAAALTPLALPAQTRGQQVNQAAPPREIRPGQSINSSIPEAGPLADGTLFEDYRLHLDANQTVRIELISPALPADGSAPPEAATQNGFDAYLELRQAGNDTPLRTDDDSGEGLNSRMLFTAPAAEDYIIRARPLTGISEGGSRTFTLRVSTVASPPPPGPFSGSRVEGDLGENSPQDESYEPARFAAYWVEGTAGERVQFDMESTAQNPGLQLADEAGTVLATNVGFSENRVRLIIVLPQTGRYQLRAQVPASATAHYSVVLTRANAPEFREPEEVEEGDRIQRTLTLSSDGSPRADGSGQIDFFYRLFDLEVELGQPVTVSLRATGFQPVLEAGTTSVLGFLPLLGGSETGAGTQLVIRPFQSGTVTLRVRSSGLDVGSFELSVNAGISPAVR